MKLERVNKAMKQLYNGAIAEAAPQRNLRPQPMWPTYIHNEQRGSMLHPLLSQAKQSLQASSLIVPGKAKPPSITPYCPRQSKPSKHPFALSPISPHNPP
eukprot:TRINITY_DN608_c0_g1_i1.p1 TRINITY_DN608_c0_g1~~TRINITY_DN608_c0_g1_i1.p1  ORF type:complete len:100 (-),score=2.68 TRINITY_DN608_c0_g1_i1:53-352(-)